MNDISQQVSQSKQMSEKISSLLQKRLAVAPDRYTKRLNQVAERALTPAPMSANPRQMWADYGVNLVQRSVRLRDTLRRPGNTALEHEQAGKPPELHFDYGVATDARHFDPPVNYALEWLAPAAAMVQSQRRAVGPDQPRRRAGRMVSEPISSGLDLYRDLNNAMTENLFFNTYSNLYNFYLSGCEPQATAETATAAAPQNPRELLFVAEALAAINEGGNVEALTRLGVLSQPKGKSLPLTEKATASKKAASREATP